MYPTEDGGLTITYQLMVHTYFSAISYIYPDLFGFLLISACSNVIIEYSVEDVSISQLSSALNNPALHIVLLIVDLTDNVYDAYATAAAVAAAFLISLHVTLYNC